MRYNTYGYYVEPNSKSLKLYRNSWYHALENHDWNNLDNYLELTLNNCGVDQNNMKILFIRDWPNLQTLNLQQNQIKNKGLYKILKFFTLLKCLKLGNCQINCQIDKEALLPIIEIKYKNLQILQLWGNNIGTIGCKILSKAEFDGLKRLHLGACNIRSQGFKALTKAKLSNLIELITYYNDIKLDGYQWFKHASWKSLKFLQLKQYQQPIVYICIIPIEPKMRQPAKRIKWTRSQLFKMDFYELYSTRFVN